MTTSPHPQLQELPTGSVEHFPGPWLLKGQVFMVPFRIPKKSVSDMPKSLMYSPLEKSLHSDASSSGEFLGGLGMFQIIRYSSSPVGPYDELIVAPGSYTWTEEKKGSDSTVTKKTRRNIRISRIYVSQKYTCWNGRKNWNIPKHLASFEFTDNPDGSVTVQVYPHDLHPSTDPAESKPSTVPFLTATMKSVPFVPSFPATTSLAGMIGMDISLVQPPLPEGNGSQDELPGTSDWARILPVQKSWKTHAVWVDLKQEDLPAGATTPKGMEGRAENFFPGLSRWILGARMDDATIDLEAGKHWPKPKLA
ncbi:hypothetical protein MKZ38_002997 [Zalerion maritima]|uniref:Uncharacterized protein n=1 Tax=Zalerion maritima TaxID=339359 RepID=A0AAD5WQH2_9PEZI|nr:hypothetical protein MKZ38_002997 [Zalerion maritima]